MSCRYRMMKSNLETITIERQIIMKNKIYIAIALCLTLWMTACRDADREMFSDSRSGVYFKLENVEYYNVSITDEKTESEITLLPKDLSKAEILLGAFVILLFI